MDFPNLPPGCSIQLERVAREHILRNITESLGNLNHFIPEVIRTFTGETGLPLSFGDFINSTGLSPLDVLRNKTWCPLQNSVGFIGLGDRAWSDPGDFQSLDFHPGI